MSTLFLSKLLIRLPKTQFVDKKTNTWAERREVSGYFASVRRYGALVPEYIA